MHKKYKLTALLIVLILSALACATLTETEPTPEPAVALPSSTPVPAVPTTADVPVDVPTEAPPAADNPPASNSGAILFQDDFSDPASGWDRYTYDTGITDYGDGVYKIELTTETKLHWANPYLDFGDVIVEVDTQKISGEDNDNYGIICRHQDIENWYVLVISSDGYAAIRERYQGSELTVVTDWVEVPSINKGQASNHLRAECIGDRISLYVNGVLAVETYLSDIPTGDVGLMAGTFEIPNMEVWFDNFIVYAP